MTQQCATWYVYVAQCISESWALFPLPKTGKSFMPIGCIRFFPSAAKQQQDGGYSSFAGSAFTGTTKEQKEGASKINGAPPYGWE